MDSRWVRGFAVVLPLAAMVCQWASGQAAQEPGSSSSRRTHAPPPKQAGVPDLGAVRDGVYRNSGFGISYNIPYGWVQRTESMREGPGSGDKSYVLLATFERPPEASGDSVNSGVVITAESLSEYPGLDQAVDYFDELDEIANSKGLKVLNPPYEFPIGTKKLARGDYSKRIGDDVTMYQGSLVMLEKGYVISFTFIAGSEDELESLIMDLKLGASGGRSRPVNPK